MAAIGRCRVCSNQFALVDLLDDWSCRCPCCGVALANDGPAKATILRNAAAADRLHTELIRALGLITSVPGNLEVEISPIVTSVLHDVDWRRQLHDDIETTRREIDQVMTSVHAWAQQLRTSIEANPANQRDPELSAAMHDLASRLRQVGETMASTDHVPGPKPSLLDRSSIDAAAAAVDSAATNLATGRGSEVEIVTAMTEASDAISATPDAAASKIDPL